MLGFLRTSALTAAVSAMLTATAGAAGTILIQHKHGPTNTYDDVEVKVLHGSLYLTTDDGDGTLVVNKAACWYQGKVMVCLPSSAIVVQDGEANALDLTTGTVYLNDTDDAQPLLMTSQRIPAHGVMVSFTTKIGTYVNLTGTIDQVVR